MLDSVLDAFRPSTLAVAGECAVLLALQVVLGFALGRVAPRLARPLTWSAALGSVLLVHFVTLDESGGFRMFAIVGVLLYGMKGVVHAANVKSGEALGVARWLAFCVLWFGMNPRTFAVELAPQRARAKACVRRGVMRVLTGALLVALAALCERGGAPRVVTYLCLLPGLSLVLHFGIFNLLTGLWLRVGFDVHALFRAPLLAQSLTEFWGRRWNLAFSEMTTLALYRPLRERTGRTPALLAAFLFSGFLHEVAISLPVRAGYGLPFAYFVLHALAMTIEDRLARRGTPLTGGRGRLWTLTWLVLPLPLLFHEAFRDAVLLPFVRVQ